MNDFSKNPVEEKLISHMQRYGSSMNELSSVSIRSKDELDRLAELLGISPSSYEGQEQAAVVFIKGAVVYGLMDRLERERFLETLHRVWGKGSRFAGAVTTAVADRVGGVQNGMNWEDLPNELFVKEYAAITHTAQLIGIPITGMEYGGAGAAIGQIGNALVKSRTGKELFDSGALARSLSK